MAAMPAPDHSALELQHLGYSIIPLAPQDKRPYLRILPTGWSEYQRRAASDAQVQQWINVGDPRMGWGLICGKVSGGAYCLDADDLDLAQWVLAHAGEMLFHGALIVESGSGKAHIWVRSLQPIRSSVWSLGQGRKAGDIRGEGSGNAGPSYMVVPPSLHPDTGRPYRIRSGSFAALPMVPDVAELARAIVEAYVADGGDPSAVGSVGTPSSSSYRILYLDDAQSALVLSRVRSLRLKKKVQDSLLVAGYGAPGSPAWALSTDPSGSGIDYSVVCELIRRNQSLDEVEEIFAASPIGDNCYRAKGRGSYGFAYIKRTYDNARTAVEEERQNALRASGANFTVKEVVCRERGHDLMEYVLLIEVTQPGTSPRTSRVEATNVQLSSEKGFRDRCWVPSAGMWVPEFLPGQRGQNWSNFMRAVQGMVSEVQKIPVELSDEGYLARSIENTLSPLPQVDSLPQYHARTGSMGWKYEDTYYLFPDMLLRRMKAIDRSIDAQKMHRILAILGQVGIEPGYTWADHRPTVLLKVRVAQDPPVPTLPMLPAPSS